MIGRSGFTCFFYLLLFYLLVSSGLITYNKKQDYSYIAYNLNNEGYDSDDFFSHLAPITLSRNSPFQTRISQNMESTN